MIRPVLREDLDPKTTELVTAFIKKDSWVRKA